VRVGGQGGGHQLAHGAEEYDLAFRPAPLLRHGPPSHREDAFMHRDADDQEGRMTGLRGRIKDEAPLSSTGQQGAQHRRPEPFHLDLGVGQPAPEGSDPTQIGGRPGNGRGDLEHGDLATPQQPKTQRRPGPHPGDPCDRHEPLELAGPAVQQLQTSRHRFPPIETAVGHNNACRRLRSDADSPCPFPNCPGEKGDD